MNLSCYPRANFAAILFLLLAPLAAIAQEPAAEADLTMLNNPAVSAILEMDRKTPADRMRAVFTLVDLGHPEVAAPILQELTEAKLDEAQLAGLVAEFGSARFVQLIRRSRELSAEDAPQTKAFADAAAKFARSAIDAAADAARNPQRIEGLLKQLASDSSEVRQAARNDLAVIGEPAIIACFAALANTEDEALRAQLMTALGLMTPAVEQPLIAGLAEGTGLFRRDLAELAGYLHVSEAIPWLAALSVQGDEIPASAAARVALQKFDLPLPSPTAVEELVRRDLNRIEHGPAPVTTPTRLAADRQGGWWTWDDQQKQLSKQQLSPRSLRIFAAARLSRALALNGVPVDPLLRQKMLLLAWEEAAIAGSELPAAAKPWTETLTPVEMSQILADAEENRYYEAAVRIVELMGERGDASVLAVNGAQPSPLAKALASPNRTLRFTALQTILNFAPQQTFPGASEVAESLWFFAAGAGEPVAVAAGSTVALANEWAGGLRAAGYDTIPATTGRGALLAAFDRARSPRLALVLLDSNLSRPRARETLYQLRSHPATGKAPVAILCTATRLPEMQTLLKTDPNLIVEVRPHGEGSIDKLVQRTLAVADDRLADEKVRTQRALFALESIAELLETNYPYDELIRDSDLAATTLFNPDLAKTSLVLLSRLGTRASQLALADFASSITAPLELRRVAATGFAKSLERFGLQLTRTDIRLQYDRYNASGESSADADEQAILASLLDAIEGKAPATNTEQVPVTNKQ